MSSDVAKEIAQDGQAPALEKDWRFYTGLVALVLACVMPLLALLVPLLELSVAASASLAGVLVAGGPEVLILVATALLGKKTFDYFVSRIKQAFRSAALPRSVSKARYYTGLTISMLSLVPLYLYGYLPEIMPPGTTRIGILAGSDLSFILSVFLMGGELWEKLRRIFVWEGGSGPT